MSRVLLISCGLILLIMWFATWATTIVPDRTAEDFRWAVGNSLAFLSGGAFGMAVVFKPTSK